MKNFKNGMTIAEVLLSFAVCGVIFLISIHIFKTTDITRLPYVYSTMTNLREANQHIMNNCYFEGSCSVKNTLPNDLKEYCIRLSEQYNASGEVICNNSEENKTLINSNKVLYQRTNGDDEYNYNLKLPSGVTIFGLLDNGDWKTQNETEQVEKENGEFETIITKEYTTKYIDIVIDTNSKNKPNKFLDDVYPIRIFQNGDVIPGILPDSSGGITLNGFDYSDIYEYQVILKYFKNNSTAISVADIRTQQEINNNNDFKTYALTFREAICRAYGSQNANKILKRYYSDVINPNDWCEEYSSGTPSDSKAKACIETDDEKDNPDIRRSCEIKQMRPRTTGFVKWIGI